MESGFNFTFHTITLALDKDGLGMMEKAIQYGGGECRVIVEDLRPFFKRSIRSNDNRALFIAQADDLEEQIGAMLVNGQETELVETEQGWSEVPFELGF